MRPLAGINLEEALTRAGLHVVVSSKFFALGLGSASSAVRTVHRVFLEISLCFWIRKQPARA